MSELAPQSDPKYLENHPDAVQDVEKAHEMAIAGEPHESEVARLRQFAERQLQETIVKDPGKVRGLAAITTNRIIPDINRERSQANQKYAEIEGKPHDFAADARAALDATKR